jgi:release factor glutamine methyltransferase
VIEAMLAELARVEAPPAAIALEIGSGQGDPVAELVRGAGYREVEVRQDLAGLDRAVIGR